MTFHNGNPFTADDVIFSLERVGNKYSFLRDRVSMIKEMNKIDDLTIEFVTNKPYPILPQTWTSIYMMDKEWAEKNDATVPSNSVENIESFAGQVSNGTGPFTVVERVAETRTVFEPFKDYWDTVGHNLDKVVIFRSRRMAHGSRRCYRGRST